MIAYSSKQFKANPPPPNSTSKPGANSDSPSAKSKIIWLISDKREKTKQMTKEERKKRLIIHKLEKNKNNQIIFTNQNNKRNTKFRLATKIEQWRVYIPDIGHTSRLTAWFGHFAVRTGVVRPKSDWIHIVHHQITLYRNGFTSRNRPVYDEGI